MKKDFWNWHKKKEQINEIEKLPFFHEREVWFCYMGVNVGFEQDGSGEEFLRPVIVFKKFNNQIFWGIPLTKAKIGKKINKRSKKYYFNFNFAEGVTSTAILSQLKLIDAHRLSRHIRAISEADFIKLKKNSGVFYPKFLLFLCLATESGRSRLCLHTSKLIFSVNLITVYNMKIVKSSFWE